MKLVYSIKANAWLTVGVYRAPFMFSNIFIVRYNGCISVTFRYMYNFFRIKQ